MSTKKAKQPQAASKMWGGRFAQGPAEIMEEINASIDFDRALYAQDIAGSIAHARMLVESEILGASDGEAIVRGLETIRGEIESGTFTFYRNLEDIYMNI